MPEALVIVAVFVVTVIAWVGAWRQARDPALHNPREELARLTHQAAWIENRIERARREQWDDSMLAALKAERATTTAQLAAARATSSEA